jgi:drug/metabolite transporter (DMT)-like permease
VLPELPPRVFNAVRLLVASSVYLGVVLAMWLRGVRRDAMSVDPDAATPSLAARTLGVSAPSPGDWGLILVTGLVGHFVYQAAFIEGLARTTAANAALLIGASPIALSMLSLAAGQDRPRRWHWAGLALSFAGVYIVVGRAPSLAAGAWVGDALMLGAVACWSVYTVVTRPLLERHSPLFLTALSMGFGTAMFVPWAWRDLQALHWGDVPAWAWAGVTVSALLALNLAYLIWYVAVQRRGPAQVSVWSNVVPMAGMLFAWLLLGEHIGLVRIAGAALILGGVALTRVAGARQRMTDAPPEE